MPGVFEPTPYLYLAKHLSLVMLFMSLLLKLVSWLKKKSKVGASYLGTNFVSVLHTYIAFCISDRKTGEIKNGCVMIVL